MISFGALRLVFAFVLVFVFPALADTTVCNNSPALCSRAYSNITQLGAHDSPFVRNETNGYTLAGDQFYSTIAQLDAGVRLLTAQVHTLITSDGSEEWHLCHSYCPLYDAGTLTAWLTSIKAWLDAHQSDVVTILLVNSNDANATTLDEQFAASAGIKQYVYTPPSTTQALNAWPTLGQMISAGTRLVVFIASLDPKTNTVAPYLLDEFTFLFETEYDNTEPDAFSCVPDRPSSVAGNTNLALSRSLLPLVNHFLYDNLGSGIEVPAVENITTTNSNSTTLIGSLGFEADQCTAAYGNKAPTFLLVDFFNVGPALQTVDRLNGIIGNTVGRQEVSAQVLGVDDANATVSAIAASSTSISGIPSSSAANAATSTTTLATTNTVTNAAIPTTTMATTNIVTSAVTVAQSSSETTHSTQLITSTTASPTVASSSAAATISQTMMSKAVSVSTTGLHIGKLLCLGMLVMFYLCGNCILLVD